MDGTGRMGGWGRTDEWMEGGSVDGWMGGWIGVWMCRWVDG